MNSPSESHLIPAAIWKTARCVVTNVEFHAGELYLRVGFIVTNLYARLLKEKQAVALLTQTYNEEKETDKKLTMLSKDINVEAMEAEESD